MKIKISFWWRIYFVLAATIYICNLLSVLYPQSVVYIYYHSLIAFHKDFTLAYYLNILSAVTSLVSLLPLFFYIYHRPFFSPIVWQILFCLRIAFDFVGHGYEMNFFQSLFQNSFTVAFISLAISVLIIFPSYFAGFQYAFRQHRIFYR